MNPNPGKTLGIKDMHPAQLEALVRFIGLAFDLAAQFESDEPIFEVEQAADELIHLLGGNGARVVTDIEVIGGMTPDH